MKLFPKLDLSGIFVSQKSPEVSSNTRPTGSISAENTVLSVPLLLATQHRCAGAGVVRGVGCRVTRYILSSYWFILAAAVVVCMENIEELSLIQLSSSIIVEH